MLFDILTNQIFLSIVTSAAVGQGIKVITSLVEGTLSWREFFSFGGMPSTHCATTSALTTALYLHEGFTSPFFVAFVLTCIVVIDAVGVRRSTEEEGRMIHAIIRKEKLKIQEFKIAAGHKPLEAAMGVVIGILSALVITTL